MTSVSLGRDLLAMCSQGRGERWFDQPKAWIYVGTNEKSAPIFASFSAEESISSATPGQSLA